MNLTVLSPHRDDAAFSLGLAIAAWLDHGHRVEVVNCFTRSEYSPFGDLAFVHANDLRSYVTAQRHQEDLRWSRKYRRPIPLADLNLRDAPQRLQCTVDQVCNTPVNPADSALPKICAALRKRNPDALILPLAIGDHVDHLTARIAALGPNSEPNLSSDISAWPASLPIAFYEDLPYAARPHAAEGIADRAASLQLALEPVFVSAPTDPAAAVARKRQLALCYDSQIDSEVTHQIAHFCTRYAGRERLWANPAWRQSPLGATP